MNLSLTIGFFAGSNEQVQKSIGRIVLNLLGTIKETGDKEKQKEFMSVLLLDFLVSALEDLQKSVHYFELIGDLLVLLIGLN